MEQQQKTLLQVAPDEKDPLLIGLDQLLTNLPFAECRQQIERVVETAVSVRDENTVLRWLSMYQTAVYNASSEHAQKYEHISSFRAFLKNLFWSLPPDAVSYPSAVEPQFLSTKQYILEQMIEQWNPDLCSASLDAFRFFIAAYGWFETLASLEETEWERKGRGRLVSGKIQKMVLDIMRDWLSKRRFEAYPLEEWIVQPRVPSEILKLLEHAWVRISSGEHVARHLKRSRVLSNFSTSLEDCPKEAQQAIRTWGEELFKIAGDIQKLISDLQILFGSSATISYIYRQPMPAIAVTIIYHCDGINEADFSTIHQSTYYATESVMSSRKKMHLKNIAIKIIAKGKHAESKEVVLDINPE